MPRPSLKQAVLDAAEAIVLEAGASHMTLDAVAERSGISKGGLMYHFPTKEAMLEAMVARMMERCDLLRDKARDELPKDRSNELMVEIKMFLDLSGTNSRLNAALLAVIANQPELLNAYRKKYQERFLSEVASAERFDRSSILYFAAMGLHFHELLKFSLIDDNQQKKIYEKLLRLAGDDQAV